MKPRIIDFMFVADSDPHAHALKVRDYLRRGWHLHGTAEKRRSLGIHGVVMHTQWVVLRDDEKLPVSAPLPRPVA